MEGDNRWLMLLHGSVTWRCGGVCGVISRDGHDLTRRSGNVGSGKVVVVETDVAERW